MTTIAWDGKTLAADKQATFSDRAHSVTKIHKSGGLMYGFTGCLEFLWPCIEWHKSGAEADKFPRLKDEEDAIFMVVGTTGAVTMYHNSGNPVIFDAGQCFAIGSGQDYAISAMKLGKPAADAVAVACELDISSGMGVDTLTL